MNAKSIIVNDKKEIYQPLYLVGTNEAGGQVLISFRYKKNPIPVIQLVHKTINSDLKLETLYSDITVEHDKVRIMGGVPDMFGFSKSHPNFIYDRNKLSLRFYFDDVGMSCNILTDTAMPFIELVARM